MNRVAWVVWTLRYGPFIRSPLPLSLNFLSRIFSVNCLAAGSPDQDYSVPALQGTKGHVKRKTSSTAFMSPWRSFIAAKLPSWLSTEMSFVTNAKAEAARKVQSDSAAVVMVGE